MTTIEVVMNLGDRVKIKNPVIFYHHPLHRNEAFDAQGLEGVVLTILAGAQRVLTQF